MIGAGRRKEAGKMSDHDAPRIDELLRSAGASLRASRSACEVALAIAGRVAERCELRSSFVVGLNGAQGSGKTTLAFLIGLALGKFWGKKAVILSLDDFYLPKRARQDLARSVHPLCATRGVPGTHDCPLLLRVMSRLLAADDATKTVSPRFSKLADDRVGPAHWAVFEGRPDAVLLEGWCVGLPADKLPPWQSPINALEREADPNGAWWRWSVACLAESYTALWKMLDLLVVIELPNLDAVIASRLKQEHGLQPEGGEPVRRMNAAEVERFVQHFERYTRAMWGVMPSLADIVVRRDAEFRYALTPAA
jgi:D-glycerate 3-kinase